MLDARLIVCGQRHDQRSLAAQVDTLRGENGALRDTLGNLTTYTNTVYYIVGTKDDLIKKGIIAEEGGSRFLFVLWKSGKTLVPRRHPYPLVSTGSRLSGPCPRRKQPFRKEPCARRP